MTRPSATAPGERRRDADSDDERTSSEYHDLDLAPHHAAMLAASAIAPDVATSRGYRTVKTRADLRRLGFGDAQARVPALVIPIYDPSGEIVLYQARPDDPRIRGGRPIKYETVSGAPMALDVPPGARGRVGDPAVPLFITEGVKKADAAVSAGLCCIALLGVWNWRGRNEHGGKTALAAFERIAFNDRDVYVAYDSDVMTKREVLAACDRLAALLRQRGARVRFVVLPPQADGSKTGLDDYLAAGHGVADLLARSRDALSRPAGDDDEPDTPYRATPGGLIWDRPTRDGTIATPLTNFTARIVADVTEDDGAEVRRAFEIDATLSGRDFRFAVPASAFAAMTWPAEHLGARAIVYPGMGTRDHARAAIQVLSGEIPSRHVYSQTGWRTIGDRRLYLHAAGAIGADGIASGVDVSLGAELAGYALPGPPDGAALVAAIRAGLGVLDIVPPEIGYPLLAATWRAALGPVDLSVHLAGATGAGKSELAALCQQHYGPTMTSRRLPGSWDSTANALEALAHGAADALFVVDDFMPNARGADARRLHRDADRLMRAAGNAAGRQRMRADTSLRPAKPPRGLILSTGEDIPAGQSLRARMLILELGPDDLCWEHLGACQRDAADGRYAEALAGFVRWLAATWGSDAGRPASFKIDTLELRQAATGSGAHRRTPEIIAQLATGWRMFLRYAVDVDALTAEEAARHWDACWDALGRAANDQARQQASAEPAGRFLELLASAIASGRAHLAGSDGREPREAGAWGWRIVTVGTGEYQREEWREQGRRVGWVEDTTIYIDRDAAIDVARELGDDLTITRDALTRRLHERGHLMTTEARQGELTVRRTLGGQRRRVLALRPQSLYPHTESGQSGQSAGSRSEFGHCRPDSDGTCPDAESQPGQDFSHAEAENGCVGRIGWIPRGGETIQLNGAHHVPDASPRSPAASAGIRPSAGRIPATAPANRCADCGERCGSARRCSGCAAAATPVRGRRAPL